MLVLPSIDKIGLLDDKLLKLMPDKLKVDDIEFINGSVEFEYDIPLAVKFDPNDV